MRTEDQKIIDLLCSDRAKGFRALFDKYYTPLCLFSIQMTDDFDVSEDIVQSFFVTFWEKQLHKNLKSSNLRSYIFTSIRNNTLAYMRMRGEALSVDNCLDIPDQGDWSVDFASITLEGDLQSREEELLTALQGLSANEMKALEQVIINDKTYKEASADMGISINTLKTHLRRAMKKLRNMSPILLFFLSYK